MNFKANNPLSPGALLLRRNLRRPSALVRKLIVGEAIGEKVYDLVRQRPRGNPGAPPAGESPGPVRPGGGATNSIVNPAAGSAVNPATGPAANLAVTRTAQSTAGRGALTSLAPILPASGTPSEAAPVVSAPVVPASPVPRVPATSSDQTATPPAASKPAVHWSVASIPAPKLPTPAGEGDD